MTNNTRWRGEVMTVLASIVLTFGSLVAEPPPAGAVRDERELLIVGKAGLHFRERALYRGQGELEIVRPEGEYLHRWFVPPPPATKLKLLPSFDGREHVINSLSLFQAEDTIELLYQMPLPPIPQGVPPRLYILQRLSDWESLKGIPYYSTSVGRMTTYIRDIKLVDAPKSHQPKPFPWPTDIPRQPLKFDVLQTDNKFAPCWYQFYVEAVGESTLLVRFTNTSPLQVPLLFFRFRALAEGDMMHSIYLILRERKLEIYAIGQLRNTIKEILGRKLDLANSFDRRLSAVQGWIVRRLYGL